MADPYLLIDGYNLMHAVGTVRPQDEPGGFQGERTQFLRHVSDNLTARERERTTVVFDASTSSRRGNSTSRVAGLTVIYSAKDRDADDVIEELIADHSSPRQILLVSSDHRLQRAVKKRRGKFTDSEEFAELLERRQTHHANTELVEPSTEELQKQSGLHSPAEIEAWLKVFGDIPELDKVNRFHPPRVDFDALQREVDGEE